MGRWYGIHLHSHQASLSPVPHFALFNPCLFHIPTNSPTTSLSPDSAFRLNNPQPNVQAKPLDQRLS
jgi:hypothetical protein